MPSSIEQGTLVAPISGAGLSLRRNPANHQAVQTPAAALRAVFLCSTSFLKSGPKVGMQFLAEGFARRGWDVRYVSSPSSLLDIASPSRRGRLRRAWLEGRGTKPVKIEERLHEYTFRAPHPVHRKCFRHDRQLSLYRAMAPRWLSRESCDVCIHDSSPAFLYRPLVHARRHIIRLSDTIEGFSHLGRPVIRAFQQGIRSGAYSAAWGVSQGLVDYVLKLRPDLPAMLLPNGVEIEPFLKAANAQRLENSAVFIGSQGNWVDLELLAQAARLLPDWQFHLYGKLKAPSHAPANFRFHGELAYEQLPATLSQYQVGVIPFQNANDRLDVCERPLKFYQYLAAGLGIASTNVGALQSGMMHWAHYGNEAASFAQAIRQAQAAARTINPAATQHFLLQHTWSARTEQALASLASVTSLPMGAIQAVPQMSAVS